MTACELDNNDWENSFVTMRLRGVAALPSAAPALPSTRGVQKRAKRAARCRKKSPPPSPCVCVVSFIHPRAGRTHATTKLHEGTGFYSQTD